MSASEFIDVNHPSIFRTARALAKGARSTHDLIKRSFEFVRDTVKHSGDFKLNPVICRASDVLLHSTGYCYTKSQVSLPNSVRRLGAL